MFGDASDEVRFVGGSVPAKSTSVVSPLRKYLRSCWRNTMNCHSKFFFLTAAIVSAGTVVYAAQGSMEDDALSIAKVKISLAQAVIMAEQHANGKASRAEYEKSKQGWIYDVEVVSGAKVFDVKVDADKGTVISSAEDKADRDNHHDKQD